MLAPVALFSGVYRSPSPVRRLVCVFQRAVPRSQTAFLEAVAATSAVLQGEPCTRSGRAVAQSSRVYRTLNRSHQKFCYHPSAMRMAAYKLDHKVRIQSDHPPPRGSPSIGQVTACLCASLPARARHATTVDHFSRPWQRSAPALHSVSCVHMLWASRFHGRLVFCDIQRQSCRTPPPRWWKRSHQARCQWLPASRTPAGAKLLRRAIHNPRYRSATPPSRDEWS